MVYNVNRAVKSAKLERNYWETAMQFTITIPTLSQLTDFTAWDQTVGIFIALVLAAVIGGHVLLEMVMSGFMGGRRSSSTWMVLNFFVGLGLSLFTLSATGSWLIGCAVAFVLWIVLRSIRIKAGG